MAAMERDGSPDASQAPRRTEGTEHRAPERTRGGPESAPAAPEPERGGQQEQKKRKDSDWEVKERRRRNGLIFRVVLGVILLVLFVIFVSLNSESVPVHFIFTETSTPLVWVFLVCALIGGLIAFLLGRPGRRNSRRYIKELERRLEERGEKPG